MRDRYRLRLSADLFNLFDRVNVTDLSAVWGRATAALPPIATFNTPRAVSNAFQAQLGLRLEF